MTTHHAQQLRARVDPSKLGRVTAAWPTSDAIAPEIDPSQDADVEQLRGSTLRRQLLDVERTLAKDRCAYDAVRRHGLDALEDDDLEAYPSALAALRDALATRAAYVAADLRRQRALRQALDKQLHDLGDGSPQLMLFG